MDFSRIPLSRKAETKASGVYVELDELIRLQFKARGFSFLPRQPIHSLLSGRHASRMRGRGLNFEELRDYLPGDDPRTIDWKVTARTGTPFVRVYTEERDRPALLVVDQRINTQCAQRCQVHVLDVVRRRFDDDLELIVVLQPERVVAEATVRGPAAWLHIGRAPGLGPDRTQESRRMKCSGPHRHIVGLQQYAAPVGPVPLECQNKILESCWCRLIVHARGPGNSGAQV